MDLHKRITEDRVAESGRLEGFLGDFKINLTVGKQGKEEVSQMPLGYHWTKGSEQRKGVPPCLPQGHLG